MVLRWLMRHGAALLRAHALTGMWFPRATFAVTAVAVAVLWPHPAAALALAAGVATLAATAAGRRPLLASRRRFADLRELRSAERRRTGDLRTRDAGTVVDCTVRENPAKNTSVIRLRVWSQGRWRSLLWSEIPEDLAVRHAIRPRSARPVVRTLRSDDVDRYADQLADYRLLCEELNARVRSGRLVLGP